MSFVQNGPVLGNQYRGDSLLRQALSRLLPPSVLAEVEPDLVRMGERAVTDLPLLAADAQRNAPRLVSFDPWGRRIDRIEVAEGWKRLEAAAAEEGLVATGFERRHGPASRVVQFAKLYLYTPSSAIFTSTSGAGRPTVSARISASGCMVT